MKLIEKKFAFYSILLLLAGVKFSFQLSSKVDDLDDDILNLNNFFPNFFPDPSNFRLQYKLQQLENVLVSNNKILVKKFEEANKEVASILSSIQDVYTTTPMGWYP
uniref:SXP/RAL-2 family protein Ani s 5-like cation-binding domain-containing protein n=1 Tax=Strongyloides stercoralis TaxID=6248 RepID=A0A0K0EA83_STRER